MNKKRHVLIFTILLFFILLLSFSVRWLQENYAGISMREIFFHITMPMDGVGSALKSDFFNRCLKPAANWGLLIIIIGLVLARKVLRLTIESFNKPFEFHIHLARNFNRCLIIASFLMLSVSVSTLVKSFGLWDYIRYSTATSYIYENEYIVPSEADIKFPEKPKNLIFIVMESLESSYFRVEDGGFYQEDIIPELRKLALENLFFSNTEKMGGAQQVSGTGWTVGALVSHTLAIPLVLPINGNDYTKYKEFLPGCYGLFDILNEAGYTQRFLIGSDKRFAGRDIFYKTHGNVLIKDIEYYKAAAKIPLDYNVWWGFEDKKLYELAREELESLAIDDKPFNLMILTADTHHVAGYVCDLCGNEFNDQYKNVLACASRQVDGFVRWIQQQPWYKDTIIVIVGDHLYMDGKFFSEDSQAYRRIYNVYINPSAVANKTTDRKFSSLDTFPSILDAMGVSYKGAGLGLGRSLFRDGPTLLERYGAESLNAELDKRSKMYNRFLYGK